MRIYVLNTGGTLGMVGKPLRPAKSAAELLEGIPIPPDVELTLCEFPVRLDSTNVTHQDRVIMGMMLDEVYQTHDAFIVFHGTDSLAETCAFFAMMFKRSLQKPLFVIGAWKPKDELGSDTPIQIANTLRATAAFVRSEIVGVYTVCLENVLDGTRVVKRSDAFYTPGRAPAAYVGETVTVEPAARRKDTKERTEALWLSPKSEQNVVSLNVSADVPPYVLMDMVAAGRVKGVLLEGKGTGNFPDRKWGGEGAYSWIDAIRAATAAGVIVGVLSPFEDGLVDMDEYELGSKAKKAGAISLNGLTRPMAEVKFRKAVATHPGCPQLIQEFVQTNFVGEFLEGGEISR